MLKREDIRVRDPFIVFEDGVYYMYATTGATKRPEKELFLNPLVC